MKEKTIMIEGKPFTYLDEVGDPYIFPDMSTQDMENILKLSSKLLEDCDIDFTLAFGTLLGAVREGGFIKNDDDVDIIVTDEERLYNKLPYFWEHGLYINRIFKTELYTFHAKGVNGHIDMYVLRPIDNWFYKNWCVSIRGHYQPKRLFQGVDKEKYFIGDISYPCPKNSENLLAWWYGRSWRIPKSSRGKMDVLIRRIWLFPGKYWRKGRRFIRRKLEKR